MGLPPGDIDRLVQLRRDLHRHPEPGWREFYTTARLVDALEEIGVDELYVGREALSGERTAVPADEELDRWMGRARDAGADEAILETVSGGWTGLVAVRHVGDGPTVGLRVDIDALEREESSASDHRPAAEGFRAAYDDAMHACGHDAHAAIGVGTLDAIDDGDFSGTLKVFFQPAEELIGGGRPTAESGLLDDVEYLIAIHVGLDHPTGEIVAGIGDFLAVSQFRAEFSGAGAHAGGEPNAGQNAIQAAAAAVQNLYGISRHADGATRVNTGIIGGGTAMNIVPEQAFIEGEVRGETTDLMVYMREAAYRVLEAAAAMHGCTVSIENTGEAPSAESDQGLVDVVAETARDVEGVTSIIERASLGGSEDVSYLMRAVQARGGLATFVGIGTDHPAGHHTARFDVDEESIGIGVETLTASIGAIADRRP